MKDTKQQLDTKQISENQNKSNEKEIEDIVKKINSKIDEMVKSKSEEIMKV